MSALHRLITKAKTSRPDAVLFDWDDTLFNHEQYVHDLSVKTLEAIGTKPLADVIAMNALWHEDKYRCCAEYFPGHTPDDVLKVWGGFMKDMPQEKLVLMDETMDILDTLKNKGIPVIIVSNKKQDILERELEHFGLKDDYFEAIVGGHDELKFRKPSFYPIEKALKEANEKRDQRGDKMLMLGNLWFVGDSPDDMGAARSDGIQRFVIGEKHHAKVKLLYDDNDPLGGIVYLKNLGEFKTIVDNIPAKGLKL